MELSTDTLVKLSSLDHFNFELNEELNVYCFITDDDYEYAVSFAEWPLIGDDIETTGYMFNIDRATKKDKRATTPSHKMRNTIAIILFQFILTHPNAVVTLCETKDGLEAGRNRLFNYWYSCIQKQFQISSIHKEDEHCILSSGEQIFASLFYRTDIPYIKPIIEEFHNLAEQKFYME